MYNGYFGFTERPFPSVPLVDGYFPGTAIEDARRTLARCVERAEGAAMVVGPPGTGKSLLCRVLAGRVGARLAGGHLGFCECEGGEGDSPAFADAKIGTVPMAVVLLSGGDLGTRRNLFQAVLHSLGQPYRGMDDGELRLALVDFLVTSPECAAGVVVLIDEAHRLPLRLMEEVRTLTDIARAGRPQVRLVLVGGCVLEERLAHPRLAALSQRLVARCYLEALNRTETQAYIHAAIVRVGGRAEALFPVEACRSVFQATGGVPRLINQVCDHALLLAWTLGKRRVEAARVEEAWADLQQLPTPWNEETPEQRNGVIEFGGLDDSSEADEPQGATGVLPALRISPDSEEGETAEGDPARQLEEIEQMVSQAGDDFEPAGSIGPELEVVFDDPFREEFEDEEPVADRCGPRAEVADAAESADVDTPGRLAVGRTEEERETGRPTVPLRAAESAEQSDLGVATGDLASDDDDIMIVEDDDDGTLAETPAIVAVRRQDYGRLFTKLRHG